MTPLCLLDSGTLSELSRGHGRVVAAARSYMEEHGRLTVSAVSIFERLRGYRLAIRSGKPYERHLEAFETFHRSCHVVPVDDAAADRAATYWAHLSAGSRKAIGDILIAASASTRSLVLVTRNRRDFDRIARLDDSLQIRDWSR